MESLLFLEIIPCTLNTIVYVMFVAALLFVRMVVFIMINETPSFII